MLNEAVTAEQRTGPYGAKGVGETGTFGVSPAIANAIHDAVGVRLTSLPLSAEAIWEKCSEAEIRFRLNGEAVSAQVAPHENLVEMLQENFGLYGARESCGQGMCGCCTVLVDGRAVSGCLYLGSLIEGPRWLPWKTNSEPDAVQQAFVEASAFQCGFCTPGFVLMTRQLLDEHPTRTRTRSSITCPETCAAARPTGNHRGG